MAVYEPKMMDRLFAEFWTDLLVYLAKVEAWRQWCREHERTR